MPPKREILTVAAGQKPPAFFLNLLSQEGFCRKIAHCYDDVEKVILEIQRNMPESIEKAEMAGPAVLAINHILKHLKVFKDQGEADIRNSTPPPTPPDASPSHRPAARKSARR